MFSQNLFPVQIEDAMTRHSGILEAAAISVPDAKYGEVVGAWVARRDTGEEGETITKDEVRKFVSEAMNPQVRVHFLLYPQVSVLLDFDVDVIHWASR